MLFKELMKHTKLEEKRHPMFEKNKFGKFFIYFFAMFWAGYLIFIGTSLSFLFADVYPNMEPYNVANKGLLILLILDFILRFTFQKPATQGVKQYLLLPIKKKKLFNLLLYKSGIYGYNAFWLFLVLPFAIFSTFKIYGVIGVISYCFGIYLLILLNNYWYLLCRTLIDEKIVYVALPIVFYALLGGLEFGLDHPISTASMYIGEGLITWNIIGILSYIAIIGAILALAWANRCIMFKNLYLELSKNNDSEVKSVSEYKFLERYGEVGEYFRLELKLLFRNKRTKSLFYKGAFLIAVFSFLLLTPIYDNQGGKSFIGIYNFAILGIMILSQVMSFEGNYLDGLMSRKESIYNLLKAKYYFYSMMIIVPYILMIPAVIMGKMTLLMITSYAFFTTGFIYFMVLQLAVYNNKTAPINESLAGRQSMGTGFQSLISMLAFGLPLIISTVLRIALGETNSLWIMLISGILLTATANLWIKNIYKRFMKRRYKNMDGFRTTK